MSKLKSYATKPEHSGKKVVNYMGGESYEFSPLENLKMVSASAIFGEKMYYKSGTSAEKMFVEAVDNSLDFDFEKTLEFASILRQDYNMRLNPAIIFIRASIHKNRAEYNKKNSLIMRILGESLINTPDDIFNQFAYYMYINGSKQRLPNVVKKVWATKLGSTKRYQLYKYQNKAKIKDLVRICHANSPIINELMVNGSLKMEESQTWETLRSTGSSWSEVIEEIKIPHMALLRNLRNIFKEVTDEVVLKELCTELIEGVPYGKQFPFRYYTALKAVEAEGTSIKKSGMLKDTLNDCIDVSMDNFPKLKGKTMCLSDNSGSAWGSITSEYGSTVVAEINNLSSFMTAFNSDEGYVGYFGDKLKISSVSKRDGILSQVARCDSLYGRGGKDYVGGTTENGIWLFFKEAIKETEFYDNIFIYSDMQAGRGQLYGLNSNEYKEFSTGSCTFSNRIKYIDVLKLVKKYREEVNPKVNIFSVQTAGYDNSILPENLYRGALLTGWTGKETMFAEKIINIWDKKENKN